MKQIINTKIDEYKKNDPDKAKDWQNAGLLLDMLAGGLSSPGEGFLGSLAGAANPLVAQTIKDMTTNNTLEKGGLGHILAHGIAGAAMAAANGGDLLSGAISAGGAEALAPIIAEFLYGDRGKNPEDLTADEKNTLSAIICILGTGAGALTGDSAIDAVIGDSVATNAVENNALIPKEIQKCSFLNSTMCGTGQSLIDKLLDYGIPSYEDITEKMQACAEDPNCTKADENAIRLAGIEFTKEKINELVEKGELSRKELALLNNHLALDISFQMKTDGDISESMDWLERPFSELFDHIKLKEKIASGMTEEEAKNQITFEYYLGIVLGSGVGVGKGVKNPSANKVTDGKTSTGTNNTSDKNSTGSGKPEHTSDNKINTSKDNDFDKRNDISLITDKKQLDRKFKHAEDFGVVTTKKNSDTLKQYEKAIQDHMSDPKTVEKGTYGFVEGSTVFYNSTTNNIVVRDKSGNPVTGFKLSPGTPQYKSYMEKGLLR